MMVALKGNKTDRQRERERAKEKQEEKRGDEKESERVTMNADGFIICHVSKRNEIELIELEVL